MSLVFEDPPDNGNTSIRYRERSEERKEMDDLLSQLTVYPEQWARLYDFPESEKEGAEKMAGKVRSAASYLNTGKGWSVTTRRTPQGWSVFAKMSNQPPRPRNKKSDKQQTKAEPTADVSPMEQRTPTFQ